MVITNHFIDDDWNLHKIIFGDTIGRAIEKCLEIWGIDRFLP